MRKLVTGLLLLLSVPLAAESTIPKPDARVLDAGGPALRYTIHEPATAATNRPMVVLIHGWSCDSSYWEAQLPSLRSRYRVVTLDLAGHGGSSADRKDWSMRAFGEDVRRVVEAVDAHSPLVLVGHSMGGPVAVEAARQLGSRVRAVIGVDTFSAIGLPRPPAAEGLGSAGTRFRSRRRRSGPSAGIRRRRTARSSPAPDSACPGRPSSRAR